MVGSLIVSRKESRDARASALHTFSPDDDRKLLSEKIVVS